MGGRTKLARGIKKDSCWDEPWVLHTSDESLNCIPEVTITLYVNQLRFKLRRNKQLGTFLKEKEK